MQQNQHNKYSNDLDNDINILEICNILLKGKWVISAVTIFTSILGIIYSLSLPNIYESKAILVPVNSSSNTSRAYDTYSGLAGLAGINLSSNSTYSNSTKAYKKISSLSFFEKNIFMNIYLPDLMAIKVWNAETNTLVYDESIYNELTNSWTRKTLNNQQESPSVQEGFKKFVKENLSLSEDKDDGFINLSIRHQSPYIAKQWTELIVNEINSFYRQKDKNEAEKAVNYLTQKMLSTSLAEIKQVLANLLKEETKKLTLIEANEFYVFDYIDPPAIMETKSSPNRLVIIILSTLLGMMLSILYLVTVKYFVKQQS